LRFFDAFVADFGQPLFERFGLGRGDGLDNTQKSFCISAICCVFFAIRRCYFELYDYSVQLEEAFLFQFSFQIAPISSGIIALCQNLDYIHYRKIPLLLFSVPMAAYFLRFEQLDIAHKIILIHTNLVVPENKKLKILASAVRRASELIA